jgi:hypothetical protein
MADSRGVWSIGQDAGGNRFLAKRYPSQKAVISCEETSQGHFCLRAKSTTEFVRKPLLNPTQGLERAP